jgi:hypothetical protein
MMKILNLIALFVVILFLTSCFKEDEKVLPHDPGDVKTVAIELTRDYRYQVYYDLGSGEVVSTNLKNQWDLGFECGVEGWHVILNTSNFMVAAETGLTDFSLPIDTAGYQWKFDVSSGNPDSTAIGNWVEFSSPDSVKAYSNEVYVIDRGYDELGNLRGLRKIVFEEVDDSTYRFRYANLDGTAENTFIIKKDPSVNYTFFSFEDGGKQLSLEPPKYDWDLIFTQYTTLLITDAGDPYPYLVTGVLSNPSAITIAQDTLYDFSLISLDMVDKLIYSGDQDEIGYDWKDIVGDVNTGNVSYVVIPGINYVIKDWQGFYYKLRFISFYNNNGDKGYPTFEYQRL